MKGKRICMILLIAVFCIWIMPKTAEAEEAGNDSEQAIPLNEKYFPDEVLRTYLKQNADTNGDGSLSMKERQNVTEIIIKDEGKTPGQFAGIEYFPELTSLDVIMDDCQRISIDGLAKLNKVYIEANTVNPADTIDGISITNCPALKRLTLETQGRTVDCINISNCTGLEWCSIAYFNVGQMVISNIAEPDFFSVHECGLDVVDIRGCDSSKIEQTFTQYPEVYKDKIYLITKENADISDSGWLGLNGVKLYLKKGGGLKTGWLKCNKKWYYLSPGTGIMATGWKKWGGKWYYLSPKTGDMVTGWKKWNGKWYYLSPVTGEMKTGWQKIDNKWYFFTNGVMKTGWKQYKGEWYYFGGDGSMATGARTVGGKAYQFSADGVCLNP